MFATTPNYCSFQQPQVKLFVCFSLDAVIKLSCMSTHFEYTGKLEHLNSASKKLEHSFKYYSYNVRMDRQSNHRLVLVVTWNLFNTKLYKGESTT